MYVCRSSCKWCPGHNFLNLSLTTSGVYAKTYSSLFLSYLSAGTFFHIPSLSAETFGTVSSGEITHMEELFFDYKNDDLHEVTKYVYTAHWLMGGRGQSKLPMSVGGRLYTMRGKELLDCKKLENFIKL